VYFKEALVSPALTLAVTFLSVSYVVRAAEVKAEAAVREG
jgi:hypothetical protein